MTDPNLGKGCLLSTVFLLAGPALWALIATVTDLGWLGITLIVALAWPMLGSLITFPPESEARIAEREARSARKLARLEREAREERMRARLEERRRQEERAREPEPEPEPEPDPEPTLEELRAEWNALRSTLGPVVWQESADARCAIGYCGGVTLNPWNWSIDHIIPLAKGGRNVRENLQLACRPCNSRKGTSVH